MQSLAADLALALDPAALFEAAVGGPPDPWQASLLRSRARQMAVLSCRQAGKSTSTAALALWTAIYQPGALVLLLAPAQRQSAELFGKVAQQFAALGEPVGVEKATGSELVLETGSRIVALPGTEKTIRGYSGAALLVVDEAARVDDELYYSIRPMLAVSGGRLVLLSTPFGRRGAFYETWQGGEGWERYRVTAEECPRITPQFLAEERAALGRLWFEQEYMTAFNDLENAVFRTDDIERAPALGVPSVRW